MSPVNDHATGACQCEHEAHLDKAKLTPNGNPGHRYWQSFRLKQLVEVQTTYGTFRVCPDCAEDCHNALHGFRKET